jgi:hypothetical protein
MREHAVLHTLFRLVTVAAPGSERHAVLEYRSVTVAAQFRTAMREHAVLHTLFRLVTVAAPRFRASMRCSSTAP